MLELEVERGPAGGPIENAPLDTGESAPPDPAPAPPPAAASPPPLGSCAGPSTTFRTLVVGNSQIYYQDLPSILTGLSSNGPEACPRLAAEGFVNGGKNLFYLWKNGDRDGRDLQTTIKGGKYDFVVIAESIDLVEHEPPHTQFVTYANLIIDAARASGAVPILYATPYVDRGAGHWGFVEMATPQLTLGAERQVTVAAGGLAWLRVWEELPAIDLHYADHSHPNYKGSLISAMVIYAAITRATPVGIAPPPIDCKGTPCPAIPASEVELFQRAAWLEAQSTAFK